MATSLPPAPAAFASALQGGGSNVASLISSGNFAASLASKGGALSSLPTSLSGLPSSLPSMPTMPSMPAIPSLSSPLGSPTGKPGEDALSKAAAAAPAPPPDSVKGVAAQAFGAVTASFKAFTPGVPQDLKAIAQKNAATQAAGEAAAAAPAAAQAETPEIKQLKSSMGSMVDVPALQSAANSGNMSAAFGSLGSTVGGALPSVSSSVAAFTGSASNPLAKVGGGSLLPSASSILSSASTGTGISGIPGGMSSISSMVNNAPGALASPPASLAGITSSLNNVSTGALNNISSLTSKISTGTSLSAGNSSASAALNKFTSTDPKAVISGIAKSDQGLASLASAGLPASAAAALQANINSLNSSGPQPIKMPTIASNTVDRSEVTTQINSQLGNPVIPAPDFGGTGPAPDAVAAQDQSVKNKEKYSMLKYSLNKAERDQSKKIDEAQAAYVQARDTYPAGDPKIGQAKYDWEVEIITQSELRTENKKRLETSRQELNLDYSGNPRLG